MWKYKTSKNVEIELDEHDIKNIHEMYEDEYEEEFDKDKLLEYFEDMHHKAKHNVELISEDPVNDEEELKEALAKVLKDGTCKDASDMIVESCEYMLTYHILESMKE